MSTSFKSIAVIGAAAIAVLASPVGAQAFPGQPKLLQGTGVFTQSRIDTGPPGFINTSISSPFTFSLSYFSFMGSDTIAPGTITVSAPTLFPNGSSLTGALISNLAASGTSSVTLVNSTSSSYLSLSIDGGGLFLANSSPVAVGPASVITYASDRRSTYTGTITSLTNSFETAGVPEAASWMMMIVGFGAVGFAMRSAKRRSDVKFDMKIKRIAAGLEA